jgi:magnesium transporter
VGASTTVTWVDLLDPDEDQLRESWPNPITPSAVETMLRPHRSDEPRPMFRSEGSYVFGVLLVPVVVAAEDRVIYQEVDLILDPRRLLTVRKTPPDGQPLDLESIHEVCTSMSAGMIAYHIADDVAEGFLDMVDDVHDEIDELEDHVDEWASNVVRRRLSNMRHDLLHIRRTLAPTRDALRQIVDDRVEIDGNEELFPHEVELRFGDAFDKMLRASEGLETARDLISGVRDYHQAKVANDQNEIMKRLTVVASLFLPATFIAGVYGMNFDHMPELRWAQGYGFAWTLIIVSIVSQLVYFYRKGWVGSGRAEA